MRILIPTIGSRGDVQPYMALALGLRDAGYDVTLASHPAMRGLVESYGITYAPMGPDVDLGHEAATIRGRSRYWLTGFIRVMQFTVSVVESAHADLLALCGDADMVIVSHSFAGRAEADLLGLPVVSVTLQPQAIPARDASPSLMRRVTGAVLDAAMTPLMVGPYNRIRKKVGARPVRSLEEMMSPRLNLVPISPLVTPPDERWAPQHRVVGYWFLDEPAGWAPPDDLAAFLDAGEPPVVISLGAMSLGGSDATETAQLVLDAVAQAGVRAVVQGWDDAMPHLRVPPTVYHAGSVPHGWLLAHAAAIVHHGGFGTTAAGLRAGIPAIVVPHIIDQYYWAQRVHELSAGPRPIPRRELAPPKLAEALTQAVTDTGLQAGAARMGERIRAESGLRDAMRLIQAPG